MSKISWDAAGERLYETGVSKPVLYPQNADGTYPLGVGWNGMSNFTESPSGAEPTPVYANNSKYLTLVSLEEFGGSLEAYTYPDEFAACDGSSELVAGVYAGQQSRKPFGLCYRTEIGSDTEAPGVAGYKLHLIYGATASPSEKAYQTINDNPEAIAMSWEIATTPVAVAGMKPTASLVIDSTKVDAGLLAALEVILYGADGTPGTAPRLPLPNEVKTLMTPAPAQG